jgi:hypothetical protein
MIDASNYVNRRRVIAAHFDGLVRNRVERMSQQIGRLLSLVVSDAEGLDNDEPEDGYEYMNPNDRWDDEPCQ